MSNKINKKIKMNIDTLSIDKAIKKTDELIKKINKCIESIHQLNKLIK